MSATDKAAAVAARNIFWSAFNFAWLGTFQRQNLSLRMGSPNRGFFFAFICLDEAGTNPIRYFNDAGGIASPRF
jgi:hypothetical protein